jgi:hypothetical protein
MSSAGRKRIAEAQRKRWGETEDCEKEIGLLSRDTGEILANLEPGRLFGGSRNASIYTTVDELTRYSNWI